MWRIPVQIIRCVAACCSAALIVLLLEPVGYGAGNRSGGGYTASLHLNSGETLYFVDSSNLYVQNVFWQQQPYQYDSHLAITGQDVAINLYMAGSAECKVQSIYTTGDLDIGGGAVLAVENPGETGIGVEGTLYATGATVSASGSGNGIYAVGGISAQSSKLTGEARQAGDGIHAGGAIVISGDSTLIGSGGATGITTGGNLQLERGTVRGTGGVTGVQIQGNVKIIHGKLSGTAGSYGVYSGGGMEIGGTLEGEAISEQGAAVKAEGSIQVSGVLQETYQAIWALGEAFETPQAGPNLKNYLTYHWDIPDGNGELQVGQEGQGIRAVTSSSGSTVVRAARTLGDSAEAVQLQSNGSHTILLQARLAAAEKEPGGEGPSEPDPPPTGPDEGDGSGQGNGDGGEDSGDGKDGSGEDTGGAGEENGGGQKPGEEGTGGNEPGEGEESGEGEGGGEPEDSGGEEGPPNTDNSHSEEDGGGKTIGGIPFRPRTGSTKERIDSAGTTAVVSALKESSDYIVAGDFTLGELPRTGSKKE